jgi:protein-disulfide isomerase
MEKLTKKEKKELRKLEWQEKLEKEKRNQQLKKIGIWVGIAVVILAAVGFIFLLVNTPGNSLETPINVKPVSSSDITKGNKNAKVTLIEYSDFQCPSCAIFHPFVNQILKDYGNKIYFVYRFFPLTELHQNAMIAAQTGYAAYKQGKFFEMADILFNKQTDWQGVADPTAVFETYAASLKLDLQKFKTDINSQDTKNFVQSEQNEGSNAGISFTPSFILDGKLITKNPDNYNAFKQLIDNEINK